MIQSMTGFGRASSQGNTLTIWAEVSSLNHRHLDIAARLSSPLNIFENEVRKLVQSHFERGRVNVSLTIDGSPPEASQLEFSKGLALQYLNAIREFASDSDLKDDVSATTILRLGPLWTLKTPNPDDMADL